VALFVGISTFTRPTGSYTSHRFPRRAQYRRAARITAMLDPGSQGRDLLIRKGREQGMDFSICGFMGTVMGVVKIRWFRAAAICRGRLIRSCCQNAG